MDSSFGGGQKLGGLYSQLSSPTFPSTTMISDNQNQAKPSEAEGDEKLKSLPIKAKRKGSQLADDSTSVGHSIEKASSEQGATSHAVAQQPQHCDAREPSSVTNKRLKGNGPVLPKESALLVQEKDEVRNFPSHLMLSSSVFGDRQSGEERQNTKEAIETRSLDVDEGSEEHDRKPPPVGPPVGDSAIHQPSTSTSTSTSQTLVLSTTTASLARTNETVVPFQGQGAAQQMKLMGLSAAGSNSFNHGAIPSSNLFFLGSFGQPLPAMGAVGQPMISTVVPTGNAPFVSGTLRQGRQGPLLHMTCDDDVLADNQLLLRKQIEFFEATMVDVETTTSGRRKPIVVGQIGVQCIHCAFLPVRQRRRGARYYPAKLSGIYQACQNMCFSHLCQSCDHIDQATRRQLIAYQNGKSTTGHGGKDYWAGAARAQGIVEGRFGLRMERPSHTT